MGEGKKLELSVSEDKLKVLLSCAIPSQNLKPLLMAIKNKMTGLNLFEPPNTQELRLFFEDRCANKTELECAVLFEGTPPIQPVNGKVEWARDFFGEGYHVDPRTGRIDYRRRSAEAAVEEGTRLATVLEPRFGQDGRDVFGAVIKVPPPKPAKIKAGKNVHYEHQDKSFYATIGGRVKWSDRVLAVDNVYTIAGNVGLKSGHITHPGAVVVQKDVLKGSQIQATGDVEVRGVVEAAVIHTGGDLMVRGGITGTGRETLVVGGKIHAKFLKDICIQAGDDVVVEKEIVQSSVKTRGAVIMPRGRVVASELMALGGFEVGQTGTVAFVTVQLVAGEDFMLGSRLSKRKAEVKVLQTKIKRMEDSVSQPVFGTAQPSKQRQESDLKMQQKIVDACQRVVLLEQEMASLTKESQQRARCIIDVKLKAHPETVFCIQGQKHLLMEERVGPLRVYFAEDKVCIISL